MFIEKNEGKIDNFKKLLEEICRMRRVQQICDDDDNARN